MAKASKKTSDKSIDTYTHEGKKRKNNPPVGLVSTTTDKLNGRTTYQHDPHIDPTLSWAGKAEGMSFEVQNVSLHIHERIDPSRIIKSFLKPKKEPQQLSLFLEPENEPPLAQAIDFYHHDQDWTNRLIAGDSLLVMNSFLVKEGMAGKVQMVYIDPPYGIKYNSNFQPFVNKRDVKDGNDGDLPAEPEMIQAFRDTWELGIHSYLTHLRDRLLLCRELLTESGSVFVQISDDNLHHVRELMDEVMGKDNFCSVISFRKTGGQSSGLVASVADYLLWYAKSRKNIKYRQLFASKVDPNDRPSIYRWLESPDKSIRRKMSREELDGSEPLPEGWRIFAPDTLVSLGATAQGSSDFIFKGKTFSPGINQHWKTSKNGLETLAKLDRLIPVSTSLYYVRYLVTIQLF